MNNNLYQPSGLNSQFRGEGLTFTDYISDTQEMISKARVDLTEQNRANIIHDNSPFELRPEKTTRKGILLIHGLYDSPLYVRDIGNYFLQQGFLVRAILLPGHGTRPGDQLTTDHSAWLAALKYGINSFEGEVNDFYLGGFSIGAGLSLYAATNNIKPKGLILFSPAVKSRNRRACLVKWHKYLKWIKDDDDWYGKNPQENHAKYESFSYHWAAEACQIMANARRRLARTQLSMPMFAAISADDATICPNAFLQLFKQQKNSSNRLLYYSNAPSPIDDNRIETQQSAIPERRILHYSHVCIPIAPNNPYLGEHGEYRDLLHHEEKPTELTKNIYFGSGMDSHFESEIIARITYNPYFEKMCDKITTFLHESDQRD